MKRAVLVVLIAAAAAAFVALDLHRYLTLEALKESHVRLEALQAHAPWPVAAGYFLAYVAVAALSLPGAAIMTLAAGALFGLVTGTLLASFASAIGATLAFAMSRYVLRDGVQRRFGEKLKAVNEGMERDGVFYLLTLRLVPVFPFFIINLVMGLTRIPLRTFYWVSQLGMVPATIAYVNAGTQLARIEGLSDVASPALLLSFAALGVLPLLAKLAVGVIRRRRVYARWKRPASFDRNLVVIGAGAAGLVTAYVAAAAKASVTLIEAREMGGDCLNYGCVPSKTLIRSAKLAHEIAHAGRYGLEAVAARVDFAAVMERVQEVIRTIAPHDSVERYTALGVDVLRGHATIVDPWTVDVRLDGGGAARLTTRSIVVAAGSRPIVPSVPGLDEVGYVTSDTLWEECAKLDAAPRRLVILGGGAIGCELAQAFARLGSMVTQVETLPRLMSREDEDVSALTRAALEADGVIVLTEHEALRAEKRGETRALFVAHGGVEKRIELDMLLCAVGRAARISGYGLEALGITGERPIETNEYLETLYPNIYAAGDVAGPYQLTHVAAHQAWYAAVNALFGNLKRFKADYSVVPWTTFIDPEVARVGLNEQEAAKRDVAYEVTRYALHELDRAITDGATAGFVKVLTIPGKDRILGVTIAGARAGDLLAEFVLAMRHGIGLKKLLGAIHSYPTFAEANKYAAGAWQRAHVPQRLLAWAARYHAWKRA